MLVPIEEYASGKASDPSEVCSSASLECSSTFRECSCPVIPKTQSGSLRVGFSGDTNKAKARFERTQPDRMSTSLAEAVENVQELLRSKPEEIPFGRVNRDCNCRGVDKTTGIRFARCPCPTQTPLREREDRCVAWCRPAGNATLRQLLRFRASVMPHGWAESFQ